MSKYFAFVCIVLSLSLSLEAATIVTCAVNGTPTNTGGKFNVNYAYDTVGSFPRAFALDISTTVGTITGVTATKVGESVVGSTGFGIFPGTIAIDSTGSVTSNGSPVAPQSDLPSGTLAGLGTSAVTVELGSLYASSAAKPANSGTILTVSIALSSADPSRTATITIAPNVARGGVVLEDGTSAAGIGSTCNLLIPGCGCGPCKGDVNGSGKIDNADVIALVGKLNSYGGTKAAKTISSTNINFSLAGDVNSDNVNTNADVIKIVGWLNSYGGTKSAKSINCPHTYN
jgi:hypothetical protein